MIYIHIFVLYIYMCVYHWEIWCIDKIDLYWNVYCNFLINEKIYFVDYYIFQINFIILRYCNILVKKIFAQNKLVCFNFYILIFRGSYIYIITSFDNRDGMLWVIQTAGQEIKTSIVIDIQNRFSRLSNTKRNRCVLLFVRTLYTFNKLIIFVWIIINKLIIIIIVKIVLAEYQIFIWKYYFIELLL